MARILPAEHRSQGAVALCPDSSQRWESVWSFASAVFSQQLLKVCLAPWDVAIEFALVHGTSYAV